MTPEQNFRAVAPRYMNYFMADFDCESEDAAAAFGNFGYESGGFKSLQEGKPVVPGSKGGYGWAQWTAQRRKNYEAYCKRNGLDPAAPSTNYAFVVVELRGTYKHVMPKVKAAVGLEAKVKVFEQLYEGAGVKRYAERNKWAAIALDALHSSPMTIPAPKPAEPLFPRKSWIQAILDFFLDLLPERKVK